MKKIVYRIHDIGEVVGGGTPSTLNDEYWGGNIPWISPDDLTGYDSVYIKSGKKFITELGLRKSSTILLPKGTLLISSRAPIGYLAIADNPICTNQGFKSIIFNKKVDNLYFYYWIKCNLQYIKLFGNGSTFPEISGSRLKRIKVEIHKDVKIQQKIAKILYNFDKLIENNNKRIKLLETIAEALYKEWFVHFRFPGYKKMEFVKENPKGWILSNYSVEMKRPKIWQFDKLISIAKFYRGKNITSSEMVEGDIPVISAGLEPSGYHNKANVFGKNITVSASGANAGYLSYHLNDIWAADCSYCQDDKHIWFIYNALKFLQPVISNLQCGAAQPHVYAKNINKLSTIIPSIELVDMYCEKVNPIYEQIKLLKNKNDVLIAQRDLLLPRLMSNKLNINEKEIV